MNTPLPEPVKYGCGGAKFRNEDGDDPDGTATAEIIEVFFGKVDTNIVTLIKVPTLEVGKYYLVYASGTGSIFRGSPKQLTDYPKSTSEFQIIKDFSDIFKYKKSGHFTFKNVKGIIVAKGRYKNGVAIGKWKHYNDDGKIKSFYDLKHKITSQFFANGFVKSKQYSLNNITFYENYYENKNGLMRYKGIHTLYMNDIDSGVFYEYYENGIVKLISRSVMDMKSSGSHPTGFYEEYHSNGKLKLFGRYNDQGWRILIWKSYNEDGTLKSETDYKNGTTILRY